MNKCRNKNNNKLQFKRNDIKIFKREKILRFIVFSLFFTIITIPQNCKKFKICNFYKNTILNI